ncbi:endonuclease [Allokutzneria oryzae]|uniref:Endonuclease n=1 Tax=Allokutzneria oryzae TaxID=1378989 RepID=A0ABV5ZRP4_9PSEU
MADAAESVTQRDIIAKLLDEHGRTYASEAGIPLADKPSPLYRLLVLTTLLSVRISSDIAVAAARELSKAGWRTARAMRESTWQQRVDALGRAHYVRYDESTARHLGEGAELTITAYGGDLRRMRRAADGDVSELQRLLRRFPRIGPVGARIFCREVQDVWPEFRPFFDDRALTAAARLGLPTTPADLARSAPSGAVALLAAALIRHERANRAGKSAEAG